MLTKTPPPSAIQRSFNRHLTSFLRSGDPRLDLRRDRHCAHPVYTVGLAKLANNEFANACSCSGWRFLINCRYGDGLCATVAGQEDKDQPEFFGISRGPQATVAVRAKNDLETLPDVKCTDKNHELRFLSIPGLLLDAFWLNSCDRDPGNDRIVPFFTARKEFQSMHAYPVSEFMKIAAPLAQARLKHLQRVQQEETGRKMELLRKASEQRERWWNLGQASSV